MPPPTNVKRVKANVTRNGPQNTRIKLTESFDQLVVNKKWTETSRNWPKRCMSISKVKSYSTKRKTKRVTFCRFLITLQISLQPKWSQRSFTKSNKAAHSKNVDWKRCKERNGKALKMLASCCAQRLQCRLTAWSTIQNTENSFLFKRIWAQRV